MKKANQWEKPDVGVQARSKSARTIASCRSNSIGPASGSIGPSLDITISFIGPASSPGRIGPTFDMIGPASDITISFIGPASSPGRIGPTFDMIGPAPSPY